jgi:hypothetical protein
METPPGTEARRFPRGWETLPRDARPGSDGRMYRLIRQHGGLRQRTLEITCIEFDAEAYSFTFG